MTPDRPAAALLYAWALVDLLQLPLVVAVILSVRLTRRLGAAEGGGDLLRRPRGLGDRDGVAAAWRFRRARRAPAR